MPFGLLEMVAEGFLQFWVVRLPVWEPHVASK
jgi:hypothetical protein